MTCPSRSEQQLYKEDLTKKLGETQVPCETWIYFRTVQHRSMTLKHPCHCLLPKT